MRNGAFDRSCHSIGILFKVLFYKVFAVLSEETLEVCWNSSTAAEMEEKQTKILIIILSFMNNHLALRLLFFFTLK